MVQTFVALVHAPLVDPASCLCPCGTDLCSSGTCPLVDPALHAASVVQTFVALVHASLVDPASCLCPCGTDLCSSGTCVPGRPRSPRCLCLAPCRLHCCRSRRSRLAHRCASARAPSRSHSSNSSRSTFLRRRGGASHVRSPTGEERLMSPSRSTFLQSSESCLQLGLHCCGVSQL